MEYADGADPAQLFLPGGVEENVKCRTQVQNGDHEVIKAMHLSSFIFWFPRIAS